MDTGYYNFYRSKIKILCVLLVLFASCVILLFNVFGSFEELKDNAALKQIILSVLCISGIGIFFKLSKTPFIEITPNYIKLPHCQPLYWMDIDRIEQIEKKTPHQSYILYNLWPRNVSKYDLSSVQKGNIRFNYSPFCIMIFPLSKKDRKQLVTILKERVPNNNLT